jgi:hypothetical protein
MRFCDSIPCTPRGWWISKSLVFPDADHVNTQGFCVSRGGEQFRVATTALTILSPSPPTSCNTWSQVCETIAPVWPQPQQEEESLETLRMMHLDHLHLATRGAKSVTRLGVVGASYLCTSADVLGAMNTTLRKTTPKMCARLGGLSRSPASIYVSHKLDDAMSQMLLDSPCKVYIPIKTFTCPIRSVQFSMY